MPGKAKGVPTGMHTLTTHLVVRDAMKAIEFYRKGLGAEVKGVYHVPGGKVIHAELKIGDSLIMLADEFPGMGSCTSPQTLGGTTFSLFLYSENVDELFKQAVAAGASVLMPLANEFWGDRYGQVKDPFGHVWALGQHIEDVPPGEVERRARERFATWPKA